jgi:uncharacterized damage-inducible protein DinB
MQLATGDLDVEIATTRRMLERLPEAHFDWKPHEKSMSLGGLATHLANLLFWQRISLEQDEFDLAASSDRLTPRETRQAVLDLFDENLAALRAVLEQADETTLSEPWTLKRGDHVLFTLPKATVLRRFGISHMVHHRGQLTVYLRLLDVPVPPSYGPTADESV